MAAVFGLANYVPSLGAIIDSAYLWGCDFFSEIHFFYKTSTLQKFEDQNVTFCFKTVKIRKETINLNTLVLKIYFYLQNIYIHEAEGTRAFLPKLLRGLDLVNL